MTVLHVPRTHCDFCGTRPAVERVDATWERTGLRRLRYWCRDGHCTKTDPFPGFVIHERKEVTD